MAVSGYNISYSAQILYQRESDHNWYGPEFSEQKRSDTLIGIDKTKEALNINPSVAMGN